MHKININIDPALKGIPNKITKQIIQHTITSEGVAKSEISIVFTGKQLIKKLKREFFNIDSATDVIAFRLNSYEIEDIEGEVYICLPVAKENADYYNEPFEREIARLLIHGSLHLIGYSDDTKPNKNRMNELENKYLKELNF